MGSTKLPELQRPFITKTGVHGGKTTWFGRNISVFVRTIMTLLIVSIVWSLNDNRPVNKPNRPIPDPKFQEDDPNPSYQIGSPMRNWDEKRREWQKHHPSSAAGAGNRVLLVTGSHPSTCNNLNGFLKNKVDYCRIHGCDVFHNNTSLNPKTPFPRLRLVRAAMVAHPESEWIWWVDPDAMFTDMGFKFPLERYDDYNLVVDGWAPWIHFNPGWIGLHSHGMFLIRNCQWSMDFVDTWARMVPQNPCHEKHSHTMYHMFGDQTAKIGRRKWTNKIYSEKQYWFQGYWWEKVRKRVRRSMSQNAEKSREECYGATRSQAHEKIDKMWPFIMHFKECQLCNRLYCSESCGNVMKKAMNHVNNQMIRSFGSVHPDLMDTSSISYVL